MEFAENGRVRNGAAAEAKNAGGRKEKRKRDARSGSCSYCSNYVYDEEGGFYACMVQLDEDEMESFLRYTVRDCPYFRLDDEYAVVRKQN